MKKSIIIAFVLGLTLACATMPMAPARADDYPSRPIKLLVGAPPGGTTDTIARSIARPMAAALKQNVIVENKPGAGGNIAAETVAKAAPDGYTLLVSFTSHTINASLYPNLPYDPAADFTAITKVATVPSLLVGNPKLPAGDLKSLIELAKAQPDKLTIGIGGIGSSLHLAGEKFKLMTGTHLLNVPYKGTAPALTDVLGGQIDLMFISLVTGAAQVHAGKLRAYGVTSAQRQPSFPDVPAIAEVVPGFEFERVVRRVRTCETAAGDHAETEFGDRRRARRCGDATAIEDRRRRAGRQFAGRVCRLRARGHQTLGATGEGVGREAELEIRTMEKFVRLSAKACPLALPNLNTDQILPARYLKWPRSKGLGTVLFQDLRHDADGNERSDFPLNQPAWRDAKILVAGRNFGGGSSREAAVYALYDAGIKCVIASSFGDIFAQNAVKNGLLTAILPEADAAELAAAIAADPDQPVSIDLERQTISRGNRIYPFAVDPVSRNQLINGWDDIDLTESNRDRITAFRSADKKRRPWASPAKS